MIKQMFSGRIGIKQYWLSAILLILAVIGVLFLFTLLASVSILGFWTGSMNPGILIAGFGVFAIVGLLISLSVALPSWGLAVRRYHDVGLSVWVFVGLSIASFILSLVFPITPHDAGAVQGMPEFSLVNFFINLPVFIVSLAILLWPGTKGDNKFGPQTKYSSVWNAIKGKKPESLPAAEITPAPSV